MSENMMSIGVMAHTTAAAPAALSIVQHMKTNTNARMPMKLRTKVRTIASSERKAAFISCFLSG